MISRFKTLIKEQTFDPGCIGIITNPFYFARKGLAENIREAAAEIKGRVLDVGCGTKPYENFFECDEYIGLEIDSDEGHRNKCADVFYDGKTFPFKDSEFDAVILNQVFEHVFNPDSFINEVRRVLKPGGKLLLTVPFVWDEHEQPWDFGRYSSFGLKFVLEKHHFKVSFIKKSTTGFRLIAQLVSAMIYKKIMSFNKYCYYLLFLLFIVPVNVVGLVLGTVFTGNDDLYLDNVVLAENIK